MTHPDYESYADYREALQRARQDEAHEEEPDDEDPNDCGDDCPFEL